MNLQKLKKIVHLILKLPFLKSVLATIRLGKLVLVSRDEESDFIFKWQNSGAVTGNPAYDPKNNYKTLKCFFYDYVPNHKDVAVIVGVANGEEVPYFCSKVKRLICIEPTPNCVRRLNKLKKLLSLSNLEIIQCAVGKKSTKSRMLINSYSDNSNRISLENISKDNENDTIDIEVEPLTKILKKIGALNIDYCKINIEGEEKNALLGLDLTQIKVKKFCISTHDFMGPSTRTYDWVYNWLIKNKYYVKKYLPESLNEFAMNYYLYGNLQNIQ